MCQNRITLQFLLLFPVHCITAREQFSQKSCLLWIDQTLLPSSYQCTDFGVSYTSYENGCFSAVNRVRHLYSDNCHLKCHGNSIEFKYGWNFINAHQWLYFWLEQGFPSILPVVQELFFWLGFIQEFHHSVARVPALRDCSCQIDAKANENIGLDLKPATILQNASLWNTQTCEFVATWAPETSQIWPCLLPVFRYCHWEWYVFNHKYLKNDRGGDRGRPFQLKV